MGTVPNASRLSKVLILSPSVDVPSLPLGRRTPGRPGQTHRSLVLHSSSLTGARYVLLDLPSQGASMALWSLTPISVR